MLHHSTSSCPTAPPARRGRPWRRAALLTAALTLTAATLHPTLSHAARGRVATNPPGDVFLTDRRCTAFAVSASRVVTAGHCKTSPGVEFTSLTGRRVQIL